MSVASITADPLGFQLMSLRIRPFVQGRDEPVSVSLYNRAFREFEESRSMTVEDMMISEKSPTFDAAGLFIAELDGEPVGLLNAHVDKMRVEKKGFIRWLGVVPEFRRKGIGKALAEKALESLKQRGMSTVEAGAVEGKTETIRLWESLGFVRVRVFSLMTASLETVPSNVGENRDVKLRKCTKGSIDDLKLLNRLSNESFREHYNFRPSTLEEARYFLEQDPIFKEQDWLVAELKGEPLGYIILGVDPKYNLERNAKVGWILDIGVLKQHRRIGIGTQLMIEGMRLLKAKGLTEAMLGVDDQNVTNAIKLYEKVGFKVKRKELAYQKSLT